MFQRQGDLAVVEGGNCFVIQTVLTAGEFELDVFVDVVSPFWQVFKPGLWVGYWCSQEPGFVKLLGAVVLCFFEGGGGRFGVF